MKPAEVGLLPAKTSLMPQLFLGAFACFAGAGGLALSFLAGTQDVSWFIPVAVSSLVIIGYGGSLLREAGKRRRSGRLITPR